jgi:hypothetical protein
MILSQNTTNTTMPTNFSKTINAMHKILTDDVETVSLFTHNFDYILQNMLSSSTFNVSFEKLISLITPNLDKIVSLTSVTLKSKDLPKLLQNNVNDIITPMILNISEKLDIPLSNLESTIQNILKITSCLTTKDEFTSLIQTNIIDIVSPMVSSIFETSKASFDNMFSLLSLESPLFINQFKNADFKIFSQSIFNYLATNFAIMK